MWELIIGYLGILTTAGFGYLAAVRGKELKEKKGDIALLKSTIYDMNERKLKEIFDLRRFSQIEQNIKIVFKETIADRFTVMFAMNGQSQFDHLTVIFDQKLGNVDIGGISAYTRFPIDDIYRARIKRAEHSQSGVWEKTDDERIGAIGDYLVMEEITDTGWYFIERFVLDEQNSVVLFCSFCTPEPAGYKTKDKRFINVMLNGKIIPKLKEILSIENIKDDQL